MNVVMVINLEGLFYYSTDSSNNAVKSQLLSALLASAGISLHDLSDTYDMSRAIATPLTTPQLSKQSCAMAG